MNGTRGSHRDARHRDARDHFLENVCCLCVPWSGPYFAEEGAPRALKARFESREGYISTKLDTKMVGSFFAPSSLLKLRFAKSSTALTKTVVDGHAQWSQLASAVGQRLAGTDAEPWLCSARAPSDHMPAPWPGVWFECSSLFTHCSKVRGSASVGVGTGFPHSFTRPPVRMHRGRHPARSGRLGTERRKVTWFR